MSELIADGQTHTVDISPFRIGRFDHPVLRQGERRYSRHLAEASVW